MNKLRHHIKLIVIVIFLAVSSLIITRWVVRVWQGFAFSPPRVPVPAAQVGPGRIILSTIDLQRELNRRYPKLELKEDGVYGPLTQTAHERAIGDQYAKELR